MCVLYFFISRHRITTDQEQKDDLEHMTGKQLKALCKEHGLPVAGKKAVLQERLRGQFLKAASGDKSMQDDFESMSDDDLRDVCKTRGLKETGKRKTLLERLRKDSSYGAELVAAMAPKDNNGYEIISKALEDAAKGSKAISDILSEIKEKTEAEPKYVEVTIRSLGMTPDKFTTGGSPSATADVIRKLAGDPFAEEGPKYGTVRDISSRRIVCTLMIRFSHMYAPHNLFRHMSSLAVETKDEKHARLYLVFARSGRSIP